MQVHKVFAQTHTVFYSEDHTSRHVSYWLVYQGASLKCQSEYWLLENRHCLVELNMCSCPCQAIWDLLWRNWNWCWFCLITLASLTTFRSTEYATLICHGVWYSRATSGRCTKWTHCHPTPKNWGGKIHIKTLCVCMCSLACILYMQYFYMHGFILTSNVHFLFPG